MGRKVMRTAFWVCMFVVVGAGSSLAEFAEDRGATFSSAREGAAAVYDGQYFYTFGGRGPVGTTSQIVKYDHIADTLTVKQSTWGRIGTSAVWTGSRVLLFGGHNGFATETGGAVDWILAYNPAADEFDGTDSFLPTARTDTAAVWDGTYAWIIGGHEHVDGGPSVDVKQILRYNPATDTLTAMNAELPSGRWAASAVYAGTYIYIFGGAQGEGQGQFAGDPVHSHVNDILRYDTSTDTIQTMATTLPSGRHFMHPLLYNGYVYLLGGHGGPPAGHVFIADILRYRISTGDLVELEEDLPRTLAWGGSATLASEAYIFGGYSPGPGFQDKIIKFSLAAKAPTNFAAATGPAAGEITMTWGAPPDDAISGYRITRLTDQQLVATPGAGATSFTDAGLPNGALRTYQIQAVDSTHGLPGVAATASACAPATPFSPVNLAAATNVGVGTITLTWDAPTNCGVDPISNYKIYRSLVGAPAFHVQVGNVLTYDDACTVGLTYNYRINAVNVVGEGSPSSQVSKTCGA